MYKQFVRWSRKNNGRSSHAGVNIAQRENYKITTTATNILSDNFHLAIISSVSADDYAVAEV